jgi:hypothetical protein
MAIPAVPVDLWLIEPPAGADTRAPATVLLDRGRFRWFWSAWVRFEVGTSGTVFAGSGSSIRYRSAISAAAAAIESTRSRVL